MENKVTHKYQQEIIINGREMQVTIKSYEQPIRKTESLEFYTRLEIMDESVQWGHMNFSDPVEDDEAAEEMFLSVIANPKQYKNK